MYSIDLTAIDGYAKAMREAPDVLLRNLAMAYRSIGRGDIERLKAALPGELHIRSRGLLNSFKSKSTDPGRATDVTKLFTDEYTGWKAASIFETGGVITGKGKSLTVLFGDARTAGGRRIYTQQQLRQLIASGKVRFQPTPRGVLIVEEKGGLTKTGKTRKNSRSVILGILKRSVTERKRLDFYANAERANGIHQDILETAVEDTLVTIAMAKGE